MASLATEVYTVDALGKGELIMALPKFKNEADFREQWIRPFLAKLGLIQVTLTHGPNEQGNDFIFADFDKFQHRRFCSVQAKNGDTKAGKTAIRDLIEQVGASFDVRIRDHKGAEDQYISAVIIMASGTISPIARQRISEHFRRQHYGENVYYLDGERLEMLERFATYHVDQHSRVRLHALLRELDYNLSIAEKVVDALVNHRGFDDSRCRVLVLSGLIENPLPGDFLPVETIENLWEFLQELNRIIETPGLYKHRGMRSHCMQYGMGYKLQILDLKGKVIDAIAMLDSRYSITVDIISPIT
jgi:hypothetical protein